MEAIRCENLSRNFGKLKALAGLDLLVEDGKVFGFLGPNGAGKTTTLRLLAGLTFPTSGRVWMAGEEVVGQSLRLRSQVGYLPEAPAFYLWMTGREFLRYVAELYGLTREEAKTRTEEMLKRVDLVEAADRRIKGYSRGMQQRLGLAQAMINRPKILLLDEPASALDPMGRRDMLKIIQDLKGETTVFLSTHILSDVERVCDQVAIVDHGKLVALGTLDELRSRHGKSIFEMEFEEEPKSMADKLGQVSWVSSVEWSRRNGLAVLQVGVNDMKVAKKELLKLVSESGLTLIRYELASASLEETFMKLVEKKEVVP